MTRQRDVFLLACLLVCAGGVSAAGERSPTFGLPPVPIPHDNPMSPDKIALGEKLFNDKRFSKTGEVACANLLSA